MQQKKQVWGKHCAWLPRQVICPASNGEVREIIRTANITGSKIRFAGALHSLSDLCATSEVQVDTHRLNNILSIDKAHLLVTVEPGISIQELQRILAQEGLSLPNQGYIDWQTVAGAIATATHGSGQTGTLSSFITELTLIDANGTEHLLNPSTNEHSFSAAVVNLGCLGFVSSVTLKCIPMPKVHLSKVRGQLASTLPQLPEILGQYDYFQVVIDPYSDELFTWRFRKTDAPLANRWSYRARWLLIKTLAVMNFDVVQPPAWLMPSLIKFYMALSSWKSCVDYSYRILSPADEGHYAEEEIAVSIEHLSLALKATRDVIDQYGKEGLRPVAIILIRFADADPYGYLSPTLGRKTAYISLITIPKKGYLELFRAFETALYPFEGRPHWGKMHFLTRERVKILYPDTYDLFVQAKKELDPRGLFANAHIDALF